jgi:hypothetical protein
MQLIIQNIDFFFQGIILNLSSKSNHAVTKNVADLETACLIQQLIEYAALYIIPLKKNPTKSTQNQILQELDKKLQAKSYFVGESLSLADLVIYFTIHSIYYDYLNNQDKESFWNLSRW